MNRLPVTILQFLFYLYISLYIFFISEVPVGFGRIKKHPPMPMCSFSLSEPAEWPVYASCRATAVSIEARISCEG